MSTGLLHVATSSTAPATAAEQLTVAVRPWPDGVIDALGHDPRSSYVEQFWLGILGPSTTWLLRRLAAGLDANPGGFDLPLADTARALGLGTKGGRHSPFMRALGRCCQFGLAEARADGVLAVRRKLPPLNRRQLLRLPPSLQAAHAEWQQQQLRTPAAEQLRLRCRRLALSLVELGEDLEATERQLERWKFHPTLSQEAAQWAWDRHRRALAAAQGLDLDPDGGGDAAA
ncbi:MAG TPA: hypothetical protein VHG90_12635 [Acidimicrobiales bacterium]|nr:hypothetical protein [Acidimicrobiales bacterium]